MQRILLGGAYNFHPALGEPPKVPSVLGGQGLTGQTAKLPTGCPTKSRWQGSEGGYTWQGQGSSWIESTKVRVAMLGKGKGLPGLSPPGFLSMECKATTTLVVLIREENYQGNFL